MRARDYFPLGIATREAFCNRKQETTLLIENINNGKHTLLMASRRYGKSSLALHAISLSKIPFAEIDFYMARNEKVIEAYIIKGVIELIGKALGSADKLVASIKRYVKNLKPKLDIGTHTVKLELTSENDIDAASNVKESLLLLEKLLTEKRQRAVLLMDEFQNVGFIAKGGGIEAAIRHVAQKTQYLTFIFSGSNRKLLKTMFEDDTRPLYKLCWKVELMRISREHYEAHIQKISHLLWKKEVNKEALNEILALTERHPYYLNKLCDRLLAYCANKPPTGKEVRAHWAKILEEEKSDAVKEISLLSLGQKAVLHQIGKNPSHLTSKQSILSMRMSSSSIIVAIEGLEEKDMIEKEGEKYLIINPVVRHYVLC